MAIAGNPRAPHRNYDTSGGRQANRGYFMVEVHRVGELQQRNVVVQVLWTVRVQGVINNVDDTGGGEENKEKLVKLYVIPGACTDTLSWPFFTNSSAHLNVTDVFSY